MNMPPPDPPTCAAWPRALWRARLPRWAMTVALAAGGGAGLPAAAQPAGTAATAAGGSIEAGAWAEGDTVRDLLRVDAQAARAARTLQHAADWVRPAGQPLAAGLAPDAADHIDVKAIYGVGKALHAEVSVNGRLARYRAGRAAPLESSGAVRAEPYTLLAIDVPCVRLRKAGASHTACLLAPGDSHD